jgi:signal transduction histidine kinase
MKKYSLSAQLFGQSIFLIALYSIFAIAVFYYTTSEALEQQQEYSLQTEFFEINSVSQDFRNVLVVIQAETSMAVETKPLYRIYDSSGKQELFSSDKNRPPHKFEFIKEQIKKLNQQTKVISFHILQNSREVFYVVGRLKTGEILVISEVVNSMLEILDTAVVRFTLNSVFMVVFLLLLAYYLSMQATKGVRSVIFNAKQYSSLPLKDKEVCIREFQVKESTELGDAFNEMLESVQRSITEVYDISDDLSHSLKSKLNFVRCQLETLINAQPDDGSGDREELVRILEECDSLTNLVNTVLDISRYSTGLQSVARTEVDFKNLILDMTELYEAAFEEKNIEVKCSLWEHSIISNSKALNLVLSNLFDNALKYCPENGILKIDFKEEKDKCVLSFENTCLPLKPESFERALMKFARLENSQKISGHGLGLYMCYTLISRLDGVISVSSGELGFRIEVKLPLF